MTKSMMVGVRRLRRALGAMLVLAAATFAMSSAAAAQEQCYGPHASYDDAVDQCIYLLNIGHCLPPPVGSTIIRQDDFGYNYCCCIALIAAQPDEDQAISEDPSVSEKEEVGEASSENSEPLGAEARLRSSVHPGHWGDGCIGRMACDRGALVST